MGLRSHLHRRGSRYYFRQRVPKDLVKKLGCKEILRALETSCPRTAMRRVLIASAIYADLFDRTRAMADDQDAAKESDVLKNGLRMLMYQNRVAHIERASAQERQQQTEDTFAAYRRTYRLVTEEQQDEAVRQSSDILAKNHADSVVQALADAGVISAPNPVASVPTVSEFIPTYLGEKGGKWKDCAKRHNVNYIRLFMKICGERKITEYQRKDFVGYVRSLECVYRHYGKSSKDEGMAIDEILRISEQKTKMNITTLNKHFTAVNGFFRTANLNIDRDINLEKLFGGIEFSDDVPQAQDRLPWTIDELNKLFATPIWTGTACETPSRRYKKGRRIIKDSHWWLPVVAIFTGMRLEEMAQLQVGDLGTTPSGIPYLQVSEGEGKRVKTQSSIRRVPVHPALVGLGFLGLFAKGVPQDRIFSELRPSGKEGKFGHDYSQDFTEYRKQTGLYREMVDFHSFRHTFATHLYRVTKDMFMVGEIIGHKTDKSETPTYVHPDVGQKYEAMGKLDYATDGLRLAHLYPKRSG